jgi:hypothetical protein
MPGDLGPPDGGRLVQLVAEPEGAKALLKQSLEWPSAVLHAQDVFRPDLRLRGFTGVSELSAEQAAGRVLAHLQAEGCLSGAAAGG